MLRLPLTQGQHTMVDDNDYEPLLRWRWEFLPNDRSGYAVRRFRAQGRTITIYLHRQLLSARPGEVVDHENGNGLDNQRCNLRLCTQSENLANRSAPARSIPYRGVYRSRTGPKPYKAMIKHQNRCKHLGWFATMEQAARAYDRAAFAAFGRFARLNFPDQELPQIEQLTLGFDIEPWPAGFEFEAPRRVRPVWAEIEAEIAARSAGVALVGGDDWDAGLL